MPSVGAAFEFLEKEGASIFGPLDHLVYVGHRHDTSPWWWQKFAPLVGSPTISVVDIYAPNLNTAQNVTPDLIHGDILDLSCIGKCEGRGLIFWDEGPEHVSHEQFKLWPAECQLFGWDLLVSCPWGYQAQGADGANLSEEHQWGPLPSDMADLGLECRAFGQPFPNAHGNLLAWRCYRPAP